jgi:hypothetical protein
MKGISKGSVVSVSPFPPNLRTTPAAGSHSSTQPTSMLSSAPGRSAPTMVGRVYRLVDRQGNPHPVLDDLYDTLEAAWSEAVSWWSEQRGSVESVEIGVEVSTTCGSWRTLRHPAG